MGSTLWCQYLQVTASCMAVTCVANFQSHSILLYSYQPGFKSQCINMRMVQTLFCCCCYYCFWIHRNFSGYCGIRILVLLTVYKFNQCFEYFMLFVLFNLQNNNVRQVLLYPYIMYKETKVWDVKKSHQLAEIRLKLWSICLRSPVSCHSVKLSHPINKYTSIPQPARKLKCIRQLRTFCLELVADLRSQLLKVQGGG